MPAKQINNFGNVVISEEVIAHLAGTTALTNSVGIVGMAYRSKADELASLLKKDNAGKGVKVIMNGNKINLELHVIARYGVNLVTVCESVIERVKYEVEGATGLEVGLITVTVESLMTDEENE